MDQLPTIKNINCVTACKPDEAAHSAMIKALKNSGFLKTQAAERSMRGVDLSCFLDDKPYENRSKLVEIGRHPPVSVMFPAPYVHAVILDALSFGIKGDSHALVVELGIGYMTACTAIMTGKEGVTVSAQPTGDLFAWASSNVKSWLDYSKATYKYGLYVGYQIKFATYSSQKPEILSAKYDAIYVRAKHESDVNRWLRNLKTGGRMVCLVGLNEGKQKLYQLVRLSESSVQKKVLMTFEDFKPIDTQPKEEEVIKPRIKKSESHDSCTFACLIDMQKM
uniref:protein-L-isoaspartate(D-aspartate) O-methyltransferase n=1 Tax=Trichobilharzia regenti TaxID=157069 RepID=A0AA85IXJ3_TRIRE|nr:unnamed protein product [Trichobilharzia regenti]